MIHEKSKEVDKAIQVRETYKKQKRHGRQRLFDE